jgi:hypothetical protein
VAQRDLYLEQVDAMSDFLATAVAEVDAEKLALRPGEYLNPVGFIYFHILRIWDLDLNILIQGGSPSTDAWHRGGFSELLGYTPDGKGGNGMGLGFGYTDAEVDEVPYQLAPLQQYHQQMIDETRAYLNDASDDELNRPIKFRDQDVTPGLRVQHIIAHSWNHIGELRMTKSMLGYPDPTTPAR